MAAKKTAAGNTAAKKTAAKKTAAKKTAAKKTAATKVKPETIAGIPITRDEIEPLLGEEMPLFAYGYWTTFTTEQVPEEMRAAIASHGAELRALKKVAVHEYPSPTGTWVIAEFPGKLVSASIRPAAGDRSRWSLHADYRAAGEAWGSNHALFLWFEKTILPWVGAKDVRREPWPHALPRFSRG